jgi:hypothetical protein
MNSCKGLGVVDIHELSGQERGQKREILYDERHSVRKNILKLFEINFIFLRFCKSTQLKWITT